MFILMMTNHRDGDDRQQGRWGPSDNGCCLGPRYVFKKISLQLMSLISFSSHTCAGDRQQMTGGTLGRQVDK